jgi:hypothetical protein
MGIHGFPAGSGTHVSRCETHVGRYETHVRAWQAYVALSERGLVARRGSCSARKRLAGARATAPLV